ncbi:MAG: 3-methyl-2-oxobutanoate hydroxymethyltransferase [Pirellulaceae bacterium]
MNQPIPPSASKPVTTQTLWKLAERGEPLTMLTAYDFPTAQLLDQAGIDMLLVGDSLAMVVQGHDTTLPVTLDQMIYHAEMVGRAAKRALVVVDLPFPEGQLDINRTLRAGARILKETQCRAVKLEGGSEQSERIEALVTAGIPTMAHIGLRPQNIHVDGGYRIQRDAEQLIADAQAAADAGAFAVLIECVPAEIAQKITETIHVPTIGIGAGPHVSGQVLVINDLIGLTNGYLPRFVKQYANSREQITEAVRKYIDDVKAKNYPEEKHWFR